MTACLDMDMMDATAYVESGGTDERNEVALREAIRSTVLCLISPGKSMLGDGRHSEAIYEGGVCLSMTAVEWMEMD